MKSGLEDRNNQNLTEPVGDTFECFVSMKSGLEDRNNERRSEVWECRGGAVSMKSGLEDRNNGSSYGMYISYWTIRLNEVRPGRPEQF